jgi:toxin YoeB
MRLLKITPHAAQDLAYWKRTDSKKYQQIKRMLEQIGTDPITGIGKPEALKYQWSGYWSRRIDQTNRLVYKFDDNFVYVVFSQRSLSATTKSEVKSLPGLESKSSGLPPGWSPNLQIWSKVNYVNFDPIVEEIRQASDKLAAQFNYDLRALWEYYREPQQLQNHPVVSRPPRYCKPNLPIPEVEKVA